MTTTTPTRGRRRKLRSRAAIATTSALLAVTVAASFAYASIPSADGTIDGCYANRTRVLRVIDGSTEQCRTEETAISWNQTGPQGPMGPQGVPGEPGPIGPAGPAGTGIESFEDLGGLPCRVGEPDEGVTVVGFDAATRALSFTCDASNQWELTVELAGDGDGTVSSAPAGIDCGADCSATLVNGDTVTLTARDTSSSLFTGWGGACTGTAPCTLTMDGDKHVTANFAPAFVLTALLNADGRVTATDWRTGDTWYDHSESYGTLVVDFVGTCNLEPGPSDVKNQHSHGTSCTWKLVDGTHIAAGAQGSAYTPNVSWSGDCWQATNECDLGPRSTDTVIAVWFHD